VRSAALSALLLLAACGEKKPALPPGETPEYRAWKGGQLPVGLPSAGFAATVQASIEIRAPQERSRSPHDFVELYVNYAPARRASIARMPDGRWPSIPLALTPNAGAIWLDLWDSSSNRNYKFQKDTREGTDFEFRPTPDGYDLVQRRRD
jgi:hypothetical protein